MVRWKSKESGFQCYCIYLTTNDFISLILLRIYDEENMHHRPVKRVTSTGCGFGGVPEECTADIQDLATAR